jgi:hypothetical protein
LQVPWTAADRKYGEKSVNEIIRGPNGRWLPGNPGKPIGARNKLAERVLDTFLRDFEQHGAVALVKVREERPADYWRIATQLLPNEVLVNAFVSHEESATADIPPDMKRAIAQRILDQLAAERAKVVEGQIIEPSDLQTDGVPEADQDKSNT